MGKLCLKTVEGRCMFWGPDGLCKLQSLGMKPLVCKVWPFIVRKESPPHFADDASFSYGGREYFVYVDTFCPCLGANRGNVEELQSTVAEVIDIFRGSDRSQLYTTGSRS